MRNHLHRASVLALYQLSIILGIALLPVALVANRAGIPFPLDRLLSRLDAAYEQTAVQQ